jgi:diaminohydroxyphosphoribosylaminopyrimidine deaminase/5-amino-6-(5-phosphoribosylamino)uracil reductase
MVNPTDTLLMQKALDAAWAYQILTFPNPAVGAVVSNEKGEILGLGAHKKAGLPHAEVLALKEAYVTLSGDTFILSLEDSHAIHDYLSLHHRNLFHHLTLHVTLEPCHHFGKTPPCSKLIRTLGLKRVVIGSFDESLQAKGGGAFLKENGIAVEFGCEKEACDLLLTPFTAHVRHQPFVFFKLALSANNVATGGIITSLDSRRMVHAMRDRCDLLVIGGNTVREDRPILDARLVEGKAPDVLIYSHQNAFDTTIPLFGVEGRNVMIASDLEALKTYKMVMVEGGQAMLNALQKTIDWYLIFRSPHEKKGDKIVLPSHLRLIYSQNVGEDTLSWYRKDV